HNGRQHRPAPARSRPVKNLRVETCRPRCACGPFEPLLVAWCKAEIEMSRWHDAAILPAEAGAGLPGRARGARKREVLGLAAPPAQIAKVEGARCPARPAFLDHGHGTPTPSQEIGREAADQPPMIATSKVFLLIVPQGFSVRDMRARMGSN